jgi:hypothetical protein
MISSEKRFRQPRDPHKVTARMLELRELIERGEFPDKDELAERIVEATQPPT